MAERKKIAAIVSEYRPRSHADVIVSKFLRGFPIDEGWINPRVEIASIHFDQPGNSDLGREMAAAHDVPIFDIMIDALTLGGEKLAVDGVLSICEHGKYAWSEKEQYLYPRRHFIEQICGVMSTSGRAVPIFNDKHLSYNWPDAKWMYDRTQELGAPFMAGSSVPLMWRNPWLEHDGDELKETVTIGFHGLETYGIHALEPMQAMVERRKGGETGVSAVTCLEGAEVWEAAKRGEWSRELLQTAWNAITEKPEGLIEKLSPEPALFLIEYCDGLKSAVIILQRGIVSDWAYAAQNVSGDVMATEFTHFRGLDPMQIANAHFSYLGLNIEEMFLTGAPAYPVERTLLTSGILAAAMDSRYAGHQRLETDWLSTIEYDSYRELRWRPTSPHPTGASIEVWER